MASHINITPQELYDNYEFKVVVKVFKRTYPWVIDFRTNETELNRWSLIFLDVIVDPMIIAKEKGWEPQKWTMSAINDGKQYDSPYISTIFKISFDEGKEITDEMDKTLTEIHTSPAIPDELKLPQTRRFAIGGWVIPAHYKDRQFNP
jgi:hypothetical protein